MAKNPKDLDEEFNKLNMQASAPSLELTEAEKLQIEAEARKEVEDEMRKEKRKEFKAAAKQRLKKQVLFQNGKDEDGDDVEAVLITLAAHTPWLTIDGKRYYPGRVYNLGRQMAAVIKEQMYRGELHENEIRGKNMKEFYGQRPTGITIGPNTPLPAGLI